MIICLKSLKNGRKKVDGGKVIAISKIESLQVFEKKKSFTKPQKLFRSFLQT